MHQLPLVIFTVLAQASVGLLLCVGLARLGAAGSRNVEIPVSRDEAQIFMWGLLIVGLAASFLHLGKPLNAPNIFRGLATGSPLSIEVVCAMLFGGLALVYTVLSWKRAERKTRNLFLALAILAGLAFSFAIANVYTIRSIPVWDSVWTFVQFSMSVAALGIAGALFLMSRQEAGSVEGGNGWNIAAVLVVICLIASTGLYSSWAAHHLGRSGLDIPMYYLPVLRILFQAAALALLFIAMRRRESSRPGIYAAVFCCILASEIAGRVFFYSLQQVSGMLQVYAY